MRQRYAPRYALTRYALPLALTAALVAGACTGDAYDQDAQLEEPPMTGEQAAGAADEAMSADADFDRWDLDTTAGLDESEFDTGFGSMWADWDANRDEAWGVDEAGDRFWNDWDADGNDLIEEAEWNAGVNAWGFENADYGDWGAWDADTNGSLDQGEFERGFETYAWDDWDVDGDGVVGRDEVADTFWDWFDGNDDDIIDENEWGRGSEIWT